MERLRRRFRVLRSVVDSTRESENIDDTVAAFLSDVCEGFGWPAALYFVAEGDGVKTLAPTEIRFPRAPNQNLRALHERVLGDGNESLHTEVLESRTPRWLP